LEIGGIEMKKRILFAVVLVLFALSIIVMPASAARLPYLVSGTMGWAGPPDNFTFWQSGNNCFMETDLPYWFHGDLEGLASLHWRIVGQGPCPGGPGQYATNLIARGTFVGAVDGKGGSFELLWVSKEWPAGPGEQSFSGTLFILSGTGELANLHGVLEGSFINGEPADTYSGKIHFTP
jgi:hypothetical protein